MKKQLLLLNIALLLAVCLAAQPTFLERIGNESPFGLPEIFEKSYLPFFQDMDNDGDVDLFLRNTTNTYHYYENTGTANNYNFVKQDDSVNPIHTVIDTITATYFVYFYDMGNDNDIDLVIQSVINNLVYVNYYENIGNGSTANYILRTGSDNPFGNIIISELIDFNEDGFVDYRQNNDVFLGSATGFSTVPSFSIANINDYGCMTIQDIDNDGDNDAIVGLNSSFPSNLRFAENIGDNNNPNFVFTNSSNFGEIYFGGGDNVGNMDFADIDNDGDDDLMILSYDVIGGGVSYFRLFRNDNNTKYVLETDFQDQFSGFVYRKAFKFGLADFNNDDKLDIIITDTRWNNDGRLVNDESLYFKNEGGVNNPKFKIQHINNNVRATNNPFRLLDLEDINIKDFDGDGDLDILNRLTTYYENTGDAVDAVYTLNTNNPTASINSSVMGDFVDIDDDGDLDFLNGEEYYLFDNVSQTYVLQSVNILSSPNSRLSFVDFDEDEDYDCFLTFQNVIYYSENTGDKQNPNFSTGFSNNPFSNMTLKFPKPKLEFGDIDNDGDLDMLMIDTIMIFGSPGTFRAYHLRYFENQTIFTATNETENQKTYRLHAFPNPSTDRFTIEIPSLLQDKTCTMQLIDITGRVIRQRQYETLGNQLQINDLANQPNGIYILNLKDTERNFQVKLVKQ